jgi:glycosyltransferase involved in cell wall biosynthesis
MTNPLITCGFTAFNAAGTIERALLSALAQNHRPIEIVVVDDCSDDTTPEILARMVDVHPEIRVFRQNKNGGVAASRNRIIQEACGEFIAFFDDDDESLPDRLTMQLKRILDYEINIAVDAPVVCHTARLINYPNGHQQIWRALGEIENKPAPSGADLAMAILGAGLIADAGQGGAAATCSQMARLGVYRSIDGFDVDFRRSEDDDFVIRAAIAGAHFVGIAKPLVFQTLTLTSDKSIADQRRYGMKLIEKHRDFLSGSYAFARSYFEARYAFMNKNYFELALRLACLLFSHPQVTACRLAGAIRNISLNRQMGSFYKRSGIKDE